MTVLCVHTTSEKFWLCLAQKSMIQGDTTSKISVQWFQLNYISNGICMYWYFSSNYLLDHYTLMETFDDILVSSIACDCLSLKISDSNALSITYPDIRKMRMLQV